jgi:hypothetical protein
MPQILKEAKKVVSKLPELLVEGSRFPDEDPTEVGSHRYAEIAAYYSLKIDVYMYALDKYDKFDDKLCLVHEYILSSVQIDYLREALDIHGPHEMLQNLKKVRTSTLNQDFAERELEDIGN